MSGQIFSGGVWLGLAVTAARQVPTSSSILVLALSESVRHRNLVYIYMFSRDMLRIVKEMKASEKGFCILDIQNRGSFENTIVRERENI